MPMTLVPYKIHRIRKSRAAGITQPALCTLHGFLKFDSPESQHCVYNELVAQRLAKVLHVPIADGVITQTADGPTYASLEVGAPGLGLPDVLESQFPSVAALYPDAAAALVAFDVLIGNADRARNLKATLVTPHIKLFAAFDHSHCLLGISEEAIDSIAKLHTRELLANMHPFYGLVSQQHLKLWLDKWMKVPDAHIRECCFLGKPFRAVEERLQAQLAESLVFRKRHLRGIFRRYSRIVRSVP